MNGESAALVERVRVARITDRAQARAALRRAFGPTIEAELDRLAERLLRGELLLVRAPVQQPLDAAEDTEIPLLSQLTHAQ